MSLLDHSGFTYFKDILHAQYETRTQKIILNPLKSMDEALGQEYEKGEAAGIKFAEEFVSIRLEDLSEQIDELLKGRTKDQGGDGSSDDNSEGQD